MPSLARALGTIVADITDVVFVMNTELVLVTLKDKIAVVVVLVKVVVPVVVVVVVSVVVEKLKTEVDSEIAVVAGTVANEELVD